MLKALVGLLYFRTRLFNKNWALAAYVAICGFFCSEGRAQVEAAIAYEVIDQAVLVSNSINAISFEKLYSLVSAGEVSQEVHAVFDYTAVDYLNKYNVSFVKTETGLEASMVSCMKAGLTNIAATMDKAGYMKGFKGVDYIPISIEKGSITPVSFEKLYALVCSGEVSKEVYAIFDYTAIEYLNKYSVPFVKSESGFDVMMVDAMSSGLVNIAAFMDKNAYFIGAWSIDPILIGPIDPPPKDGDGGGVATPEPSTWALLAGMGLCSYVSMRKRAKAKA